MTNLFELYTHPDSANGRKVLAAAYHLNLECDIISINVYQGEGQKDKYLKINPLGKIPTLKYGDFILWESNAILQYMSEKFANFQLSSKSPEIRAEISCWLFWEAAHWQPAISVVLQPVVAHHLLPKFFPAPNEKPDWEQQEFKRSLTFLNEHLTQNKFLVKDQLSIADFSVAGMMTYFRFAQFPFEKFPALCSWYEFIEVLDAWKKTESVLWAVS